MNCQQRPAPVLLTRGGFANGEAGRWTQEIMKKWIIGIMVVAMLAAGWRVGARWYFLHRLYRHPNTEHRVAIIPTELDLSSVQITHGLTCNVGYAEFTVPSTGFVNLKESESGAGVNGETENLRFGFIMPFDPSASDKTADPFKKELSKLPKGHPLREQLSGPNITHLDLLIYSERTVPEPIWKTVLQDSTLLAFNTMQLVMKGYCTGIGMHSVHTFHTPQTRGLIRVGKTSGDVSSAHVAIENRSGTQGVGISLKTVGDSTNDIMPILSVILKTFHFTVENLNSRDDVKKIIAEAGILPREEEKEGEGSGVSP